METSPTVPRMAELQAAPSWRTVDFISDLHLNVEEPATFAAWQAYLQNTPADAVFILGDLFEVWVGDDAVSADFCLHPETSFENRCASALSQASSRLALFFMHGNRDFLVGPSLMALCNATLLDDPTVLTFAGQRWLLSHGDALCLNDTDYLQALTLIHGHTHKPAVHDLGQGFSRVVLSDWDAQARLPRADVLRLSASGLQRITLLQP